MGGEERWEGRWGDLTHVSCAGVAHTQSVRPPPHLAPRLCVDFKLRRPTATTPHRRLHLPGRVHRYLVLVLLVLLVLVLLVAESTADARPLLDDSRSPPSCFYLCSLRPCQVSCARGSSSSFVVVVVVVVVQFQSSVRIQVDQGSPVSDDSRSWCHADDCAGGGCGCSGGEVPEGL